MASILRPEHVQLITSHECVLNQQVAGRGGLTFPPHARMGSNHLPHRGHLNPKACTTNLLDTIGEGMGSIGGQAGPGRAKTGHKFALVPGDLPART